MTRMFVALGIDKEIRDNIGKISDLFDDSILKARFTPSDNLHVTLKFIGEKSDNDIDDIIEAIKNASSGFSPFNVTFEGMGVFPNSKSPRILWVGMTSDALPSLAKSVEVKLSELGIKKETRPFRSHVTIARIKEAYSSRKINDIIESSKETCYGTQKISSIELKKSILTPKGPIYSTLGDEVLL